MPIEIKELHITANVKQQETAAKGTIDIAAIKNQILTECMELIHRMHKELQER